MELSKIKSYIGFAIKSRNIKFGVDEILKLKHSTLILVSKALAESSLEKVQNFALNRNCEILLFEADNFSELFSGNQSVKAVAVVDDNLAIAIKKYYD